MVEATSEALVDKSFHIDWDFGHMEYSGILGLRFRSMEKG